MNHKQQKNDQEAIGRNIQASILQVYKNNTYKQREDKSCEKAFFVINQRRSFTCSSKYEIVADETLQSIVDHCDTHPCTMEANAPILLLMAQTSLWINAMVTLALRDRSASIQKRIVQGKYPHKRFLSPTGIHD